MRPLAAVLALLLALACTPTAASETAAPAPRETREEERAAIIVENHSWKRATIYLACAEGQAVRLGDVEAESRGGWWVPVCPAGRVRLAGKMFPGGEVLVTDWLAMEAGKATLLTLHNHLPLSSWRSGAGAGGEP